MSAMKPYFLKANTNNNINHSSKFSEIGNNHKRKAQTTTNFKTSKKKFMTLINKSYLDEYIKTKNGANAYSSSGNKLVDFNFSSSTFRTSVVSSDKTKEELWIKFKDCLNEDPIHSLEYLLFIRDIEHGLGERDTFRFLLFNTILETGIVELLNIPLENYGRWDDYVELYFMASASLTKYYPSKTSNKKSFIPRDRKFYVLNRIRETILQLIKNQLKDDYAKVLIAIKDPKQHPSISLLAKWLPSVKTSSEKSVLRAKKLCKALKFTEKKYRLRLSTIRKYLNVVEVKMSANNWTDINYEAVPSKANMLYSYAFLNHDRDRREEFLKRVREGKSEIKTSTLYPYEIVEKADNCPYENEDLELVWNNYLKDSNINLNNTIVVRDGSGSMTTSILNRISCLDVANSITLLAANFCKGDFHNKFITFSRIPELVDLTNQKSLKDKLNYINHYDDYQNTDAKSVFDLILKTAIENKLDNKDLPKNVLVLSDMEFDSVGLIRENKTVMEEVQDEFEEHGYDLPKLIFWNISACRNIKIPVRVNNNGIILVSGFSKSIFDIVTSNELDPVKALFKVLESERFSDPILNTLEKCKSNYGKYTIEDEEKKKSNTSKKNFKQQNNNRRKNSINTKSKRI